MKNLLVDENPGTGWVTKHDLINFKKFYYTSTDFVLYKYIDIICQFSEITVKIFLQKRVIV